MKNQRSILPYTKRNWLFLVLIFLLLSYFLSEKNTLSDSLNLRPEIGTRGLGLSGAFISSADDATSPLWNPAGLAALQRGNLIYDLSQGAFSLAYPIKSIGTFGINFLDLNGGDRFLVEHASNPIGSFELGSNQALLSYARKFGPLQLGASTGYSRAPYYGSRWAQNYDVGMLTELNPYLTLGIRFRDISGVTIRHQNGQVLQTFDQQLALGVALTPHPIIRWHNRLDITVPGFGTSLEIGNETITARVGSAFSFGTDIPSQSWSAGFSISQLGKQLHYTYLNYGDVEYKHLVSIGMFFGGQQPALQKSEIDTNQKKSEINAKEQQPHAENATTIQPTVARSTTQTQQYPEQKHSKYKTVQLAKKHDLDVELLLAIVYAESNFNPLAVSENGAAGLMQIMPHTAQELGLNVPKYNNKRKPKRDAKADERFDPTKNLQAGLTYFKKLLEKYRGDLTLTLGAYNVGPGRVRVRGPLISKGKKYANKVLTRYRLYRDNVGKMEVDLKRLEVVLND